MHARPGGWRGIVLNVRVTKQTYDHEHVHAHGMNNLSRDLASTDG